MYTRRIEDRIRSARTTLQIHALISGNEPDEEETTLICDLLADLLHLCSAEGIDLYDPLGMAELHCEEEVAEEEAKPDH